MIECLELRNCDRHGLGSKPTFFILLYPWEKHFMALSLTWWSWQAVLNYNHIFIKFQVDSNILASPEAGRGNCLSYALAPQSLSYVNKYKDKQKLNSKKFSFLPNFKMFLS